MKGKANVEAMEASVDERDLEHPGALKTAEKDILNAKSTAENESENQNEDNHNNESESESEGGSGNEDNSEYESSDEDTPDICARKDLPAPILERTQKLALLRQKMYASERQNRKDVYKEVQASKNSSKAEGRMERKRKEALEALRQQEITDLGLDYERVRSWDYSAEDVERYNKKMEEKKENHNPGFADYNDVANRKYKKLVREIKPDLESYNYQKKVVEAINSRVGESAGAGFDDTNILLDDQLVRPSDHNLEKLSNSIVQSQANSAKRQKASIKKANRDINKTGEVTYINDRNAHFNRKIARAYDPYTKEIRDSFERGTAL